MCHFWLLLYRAENPSWTYNVSENQPFIVGSWWVSLYVSAHPESYRQYGHLLIYSLKKHFSAMVKPQTDKRASSASSPLDSGAMCWDGVQPPAASRGSPVILMPRQTWDPCTTIDPPCDDREGQVLTLEGPIAWGWHAQREKLQCKLLKSVWLSKTMEQFSEPLSCMCNRK